MGHWDAEGDDIDVAVKLAEDDLYRALAKRPRRHILSYLLEESESTVEELARVIAGCHAGESMMMVAPAEYERIQIQLYHQHIPYLDDHGYVEFDSEENIVRICELDADIQLLIRRSIEAEAQLDQ